jgi:bifunctional non-homologous end joining protein LigD
MDDPLGLLPAEAQEDLSEEAFPRWLEPMLATLVDEPFSDEGWIYERKLDGERCLAFVSDDDLRLKSRNQNRLNDAYPELAEAMARTATTPMVVDGEVVAFEGGTTSFERLQGRMQIADPEEARQSRVKVYYYLFDILHLDGASTRDLPLRTRKSLLRRVLDFEDPLRFATHRNREGEEYYRKACASGWEGVIAKDAGAPYFASRSRRWLKFKCVSRQEFVVGGFTDPEGERTHFGALLVGYFDGDELVYAGKVGTGYDEESLEMLADRMGELRQDEPPFGRGDPPEEANWVDPELVVEVGFTEWTRHGKLRHPRYLGLRRDKKAREVTREEPS